MKWLAKVNAGYMRIHFSTMRWLALWATLAAVASAEQRFASEPQDQTAIEGSRVTLPCRVIDKTGELQWTIDDFGLGTHRNLSQYERYSMIGSDEEGDFSLQIYPVELQDDARYQCQVGPGRDGQPGIRSKFARLTVLVVPEPPQIIQGDYLVTTEDREIELECISLAGKPAAEIIWLDGKNNTKTKKVEYIVEPLPDGKRFTAKSILKLTPKRVHHNTTFTCQAQNTAERTYRSAYLKLEVKYAPKVTLSIIKGLGSSDMVTEGTEVRLGCKVDANPLELSYRWYLNDSLIPGDFTTEMMISNITRQHHGSIVKCEVYNPVGKSEESETLQVRYRPTFRTRPKDVEADIGDTVSLNCNVDGNPQPSILWVHEKAGKVVGTKETLTLKVNHTSAGLYSCRATVNGFPSIQTEATIFVKGPPKITRQSIAFGMDGDDIRLECIAVSIPKADYIVWTFQGRVIGTNDKDYTILQDLAPEGIKSTLVITESHDQLFGTYNCSVKNKYGTDVAEIILKPQKTFPLLVTIMGVIGGIILMIAIALIFILCHKREKKPQDCKEIEKQCSRDSDRSSNISDLKMELRTASSVSNMQCDIDYGQDSETGSESVITRIGVPLAGPVPMPLNGGDTMYRYSTEFSDPVYIPKDGQSNNGYMTYMDYSRDYETLPPPPPPLESSRESLSALAGNPSIDPRYSAVYGNPYLRNSSTSLPAPPSTLGPPAPPPYSAATRNNGAAPQVARLPNSPNPQYIVPNIQPANGKRGSLATHV